MDNRLLIHVGYHKTGTTWLQNHLFSSSECGFISPWGDLAGIAVDTFICINPFKFNAKQAREVLLPEIKKANQTGKIPVLSNEALCGRASPLKRYEKQVADRLQEALPEAKILISVRQQKSSILSHYRQYIANGHPKTIEDYLGGDNLPPGFHPDCSLDRFEYDVFVAYYMRLFDKTNVLVVLQEELLRDRQKVCDDIAGFLGMKRFSAPRDDRARIGQKGLILAYRRYCNQLGLGIPDWSKPKQTLVYGLVTRLGNMINKLSPKSLDEKIEKQLVEFIDINVGDRYKSSNARLKQLINKDIEKFGYEV